VTEESQEIKTPEKEKKFNQDKINKEDVIPSSLQIERNTFTPVSLPKINIEEVETDLETLAQEITEEPSTKTEELTLEEVCLNPYNIVQDSLDLDTTFESNSSIQKFTHGNEEFNIRKVNFVDVNFIYVYHELLLKRKSIRKLCMKMTITY
jgi:hypothetical protein